MNIREATKLAGTKDILPFSFTSPQKNEVKGYIVKAHSSKLGSLLITSVNGKETLDYVQSMPKLHYMETISGDKNFFTTTIQNRYKIKHNDIHILNKEDGTCICFYPLRLDGEILEIISKTRGQPIIEKGYENKETKVFVDFLELVKEMVSENSGYVKLVREMNMSLSCELFGFRNPVGINYEYFKIPLALEGVCVLEWGRVIPTFEGRNLMKKYKITPIMKQFEIDGSLAIVTKQFGKRYSEFLPADKNIIFTNLPQLYTSLETYYEKMNLKWKKENKKGVIIEGSVWHVETEKESFLVKNKATTVRIIHKMIGGGVTMSMIHHACRRAYEDMTHEDFLSENKAMAEIMAHLKEDIPEEMHRDIPKFEARIKRGYGNFRANMVTVEKYRKIARELRDEFCAEKNLSVLMKEFAKRYPELKSKSGLVFQILSGQRGDF